MTKKRFIFDRDTVAINIKTPIVYDNEEMTIGEVLNKLNELYEKNNQLEEDLDYYKAKCASLETGMFNLEREYYKLKKENQELKLIIQQDEFAKKEGYKW